MKDLLTKPDTFVEIEKTAEMGETYLSANTTNWVKEIITVFLQRFPYMQQETMGVTWTKKDDDKGYAIGSLNVLELNIPVIVNGFKMSPLDVMILPNMTLPLNDYFLKQYYERPEAFKGLEQTGKKTSENLFGAQNALHFSPNNEYYGNNVKSTVRDAVKVASANNEYPSRPVITDFSSSELLEIISNPPTNWSDKAKDAFLFGNSKDYNKKSRDEYESFKNKAKELYNNLTAKVASLESDREATLKANFKEVYMTPFGDYLGTNKPGSRSIHDFTYISHETNKKLPAAKANLVDKDDEFPEFFKSFTQEFVGRDGKYVGKYLDEPAKTKKTASVIDSITFVHPDDAKAILKEAASNPQIVLNFKKADNTDILEKIAKKALQQTKTASLTDFINSLEIDRQFAYKDENSKTFVKQANSGVMKTWTTAVESVDSTDELELKTNDKVIDQMDKVATTRVSYDLAKKDLKVGETASVIQSFDNSNEMKVLFDDFQVTDIQKIADLEKVAFFKVGDSFFALGADKTWTLTKEAGVNTINFDEIEGESPRIGDYGVFITKTAATKPFEITGVSKIAGKVHGQFEIDALDGFNPVHYSLVNHKSEEFASKENTKTAFWVPSNAKFVKIAGMNDKLAELKKFEAKIKIEGLNGFNKVAMYVSETEETRKISETTAVVNPKDVSFLKFANIGIEKIASVAPKHTVLRDGSGLYVLVGEEFNKYAAEAPIRNLSLVDAQWAAIHCGATKEDVEKIAELRRNSVYELEGELKAPMTLTELDAKYAAQSAASNKDNDRLFTRSLIKEAANLKDKVTVDAVLSLGMLRPRNLAEYIAVLPTFEYSLSEMAKLLIAARLGMAGMDVDSIKNCMEGLGEVVVQLQNADAANKAIK